MYNAFRCFTIRSFSRDWLAFHSSRMYFWCFHLYLRLILNQNFEYSLFEIKYYLNVFLANENLINSWNTLASRSGEIVELIYIVVLVAHYCASCLCSDYDNIIMLQIIKKNFLTLVTFNKLYLNNNKGYNTNG